MYRGKPTRIHRPTVVPLGEIDIEQPLAEVYDTVEFIPEPGENQTA